MFQAYDFIYDGKSSASESLKLLFFDGAGFSEGLGIPQKDINLYKTPQASKWRINSVAIDKPLTFEIEIHVHKKHDVIPRNIVNKINSWLFDHTKFKKLQIINSTMQGLYFMAVFESPTYIYRNGEIIGYKATVVTDNVGAYRDKTVTKQCSGETEFNIKCVHDGIYDIKPQITIQLTNDATDIAVRINNEKIILSDLIANSVFKIDVERLMVDYIENPYINNRYNMSFPILINGVNTVSVEGDCVLTIKYSEVHEVGA